MSKVLVVVGDEDLRCALAELVRDHGCDVVAAPDGATALELLRSGPLPALVLLDAQLPDMSVVSILAAIRSNPGLAAVRVVSMSTDPCARPGSAAAHVRLPDQEPELATILQRLSEQ